MRHKNKILDLLPLFISILFVGGYAVSQPLPSTFRVVGPSPSGSTVVGSPVLIGGSDGTNARSLSTDTSGRPVMVGAVADGAATAGNPVLIGATDGTNTQTLLSGTDGRLAEQKLSRVWGTIGTAVTISTSGSDATGTLTAGTVYRCTTTVDTHLRIGATATTSDTPLYAKTAIFFMGAATGGANATLHAINDTGTGTVFCTPMTATE